MVDFAKGAVVDKHVLEYISLYLDDELAEGERTLLETHVKTCADCRAALHAEQELISAIRSARPLHAAPEALREKVAASMDTSKARRTSFSAAAMLAACAVLLVGGAVSWFAASRSATQDRSSLVNVAVNHHVRYLRGELPLEVFSDSPEKISAWFQGKLAFNLKLPEYPQPANEPKPYHVEGARLVGFKEDHVAYIVYRLNGHPISLLVTPDAVAKPAGGEEIPWEGLRFHFQSVSGWKVLTWSDAGLTYALVSDLAERGQASCIVCHHDERVFRGLQSAPKRM